MDWNKIKAEYISGGTSYRKLAEKYGVSRTTLERKAKDEKWSELRRQAEGKAEAKIVNAISNRKAKTDDKYFRLVDMLLDKTEDLIVSTPIWQPQTIKDLATAMKYLKECKGVRTEADIREQEARIAKLQKDAQEEAQDKSITIVFGSETEDFSE